MIKYLVNNRLYYNHLGRYGNQAIEASTTPIYPRVFELSEFIKIGEGL
jgi:hypothetical protein